MLHLSTFVFLVFVSIWDRRGISPLPQPSKHKSPSPMYKNPVNITQVKDLKRIDDEPMEFEWDIFARIHFIGNSRRDSKVDD